MVRFGHLAIGPAGCGKSTYCALMQSHAAALGRTLRVVNLDPAAEDLKYAADIDVRDLISVEDVLEDTTLKLGPNGALVFCMEYLCGKLDWLRGELGEEADGDYFLFDCPGQIELYLHVPQMRHLVHGLLVEQLDFRLAAVFMLDSQFLIEPVKYLSGLTTAMSAMINLELPHVNVMSKVDLLDPDSRRQLESLLTPDVRDLVSHSSELWKSRVDLAMALGTLVDMYGLVRMVPLDPTDEECVGDVLAQVEAAIQFGEDEEPRTVDLEPPGPADSGVPSDE